MLTREDDIDVHALRRQGWTITAIARHLGRDRKTIRSYLAGDRQAGVRARTVEGPFELFAPYCAQRLADDPHLWGSTLFDELRDLGYVGSYPTMTRQIRNRRLRPACEPCRPATGRPIAVIDHPGGEETQWDWVELPDPPPLWGWGVQAHLLVGALSHSGAWRGLLCESEDQPHLIDGLHRVAGALGGLTKDWRFDRMATVITPGTGRVSASFAGVAKHYGVVVRPCPPRRGNRKGVVEKANHVAAQRFWRTLPDNVTLEEAQLRLDTWCARRGDARVRSTPTGKTTVGALAATERLGPVPAAVPRDADGGADGLGAGVGVLPRQPVLGAARARRREGHRHAAPGVDHDRHRDHARAHGRGPRRHRDGPPPAGGHRGRGHDSRRRPRPGPRTRGDGRGHLRGPAPRQGPTPTQPRRPGRRGRPGRPDGHRDPRTTTARGGD